MTHRHADHISGFSKGKDIFAKFKVERIWMSWYENPKDDKAMALQKGITDVASQLTHALAARGAPADQQYLNMVQNITGEALAGAAGMNQDALQMLHNFPGNPPIDYYKAGDTATLPQSLIDAGLSAQILGPPIDAALIKKTNNKSEEYLAVNDTVRWRSGPTVPTRLQRPAGAICQHGLRLHTAQGDRDAGILGAAGYAGGQGRHGEQSHQQPEPRRALHL